MLTPKRERFVNEYLVDMNGAQAARRAGYAVGSARQTAHLLLTKPDIQDAIRAEQDELARETSITPVLVIEKLYEEAREAPRPADRIHALEVIGKSLGMFKQHVQHSGTVTHEHLLELSPSQLARMEAIYDEPIDGTARVLDEDTQ